MDRSAATVVLESPERRAGRRQGMRAIGAFAASALGAWAGLSSTVEAAPADVGLDVDPRSALLKLVQRVSFGVTAEELSLAQQLGFQGYLERHLDPQSIDDAATDALLAPLTTLTMTAPQLYAGNAADPDNFGNRVVDEQVRSVFIRAVFSKRQLLERMVEFWTDHLNVPLDDGDLRLLKPVDQRDVIRANAMRMFPALLRASAYSPAMLNYLNNDRSVAGAINENYAREIMELHALSPAGGYTHDDIVALARALTGWGWIGYDPSTPSTFPVAGTFFFDETQHDTDPKTFLGVSMPAGRGIEDGEQALSILSSRPACAKFIATKLARRFLSDAPPPGAVAAAATVFAQTGGDIRAVLRSLLTPANLYDAPARVKRPFHYIVSALRLLATQIGDWGDMLSAADTMGNEPFGWHPPNGYPDSSTYWSGLVLPRWNFAADLTSGLFTNVQTDFAALFGSATTAAALAGRINTAIFAGAMPPAQLALLTSYLSADPSSPDRRAEAIGLALSFPVFQTY